MGVRLVSELRGGVCRCRGEAAAWLLPPACGAAVREGGRRSGPSEIHIFVHDMLSPPAAQLCACQAGAAILPQPGLRHSCETI